MLASGFAGVFPPLVRFLFAVSIVSWIPGVLSLRFFLRFPTTGVVERSVLSFVLGLGGVSLITWLATLIHLSFNRYAGILQWILALFFAATAALGWRESSRDRSNALEPAAPADGAWSGNLQVVLVGIAVVLAAVAAVNPPRLDYHQDSFDHIGYVRHVAYENSLEPSGVLAAPIDAPERPVKADPRKGTFHPVAAVVARLAGLDPIDVWRSLPMVLFPLAFLAFVWFCSPFLPRAPLVFACAALFLLFQGGAGVLDGPEFANGQGVWLVYYWTLVPLCLRYGAGAAKPRRLLAGLLVMFAGGALMHIGVVTNFAILLGTLLLFHRWFGLKTRPVLQLVLWGGATTAVIVAWKAIHSLGTANEIHVHPQGLLYIGDWMYVVSPIEVLRQHGLLYLGGLVLVPFLLLGAKNNRHARLLVGLAAIPYLVCFCPPLTPLFYRLASYMAFRSLLGVPVFAAIVTTVFLLAGWSRRHGWVTRAAVVVVLLVWSELFLVTSLDAFTREVRTRRAEGERESLFDRYEDLLTFMRSRPGGSVVLSDPKTSYLVSAAADVRVVAVLGQHGNPNDPYAFDRLAAVRDVLSPFVILDRAAVAIDRFDVDFIVVNGRLEHAGGEFLVDWDSSEFALTRDKLSNLGARLRPVFEAEDLIVFMRYPGTAPDVEWTPPDIPVVFEPRVQLPCIVFAPDKAFEIVHTEVLPLTVLPGETVEITLGYEKYDVDTYQRPFTIYVRFDHESLFTAEREYPGEKLVRRWRERRGGYRLRYRYDHHPFGGLYPMDLWPVGVTFYETFGVKLPATLEPGVYAIEFKIERESLLPNFTLRDLLYNRDHYSGQRCMLLEVTRQLVR